MLSINTDLSSLIIQNTLKTSTQKLNQAVERMSTGFKINHAKDNAAGYSIITEMNTKIGAYQVAEENTAMSLDLITTASDSLSLINDKLVRLRALAEQAENGTYGTSSLNAVNAEANSIVDEIQKTYSNTSFNGINLLKGKYEFIKKADDYNESQINAMTSLASVSESTVLAKGTYSISSADDLAKLGRMAKNKKLATGSEFVLAKDIDLSEYSSGEGWEPISKFNGTFNGNGHVISNLYINRPNNSFVGLFGDGDSATIKNLGVENANIVGGDLVGIIIGVGGNVINCYSTGSVTGEDDVGGIMGGGMLGYIITDSFSSADVTGINYVGGIAGDESVRNCYSTGTVIGENYVGGIVGCFGAGLCESSNFTGNVYGKNNVGGIAGGGDVLSNCKMAGNVYGTGFNIDKIAPSSYPENCNVYASGSSIIPNANGYSEEQVRRTFQIGIDASEQSQISCNTGLSLRGSGVLRNIGKISDTRYLDIIDKIIEEVNSKQITYGSTQNRLESALEEISTQYENLVSSRSTLRDADISKVSSEYIKQQILQQASATLLASANQSPALALQLI